MALNPGSWIAGLRQIDRLLTLERKLGAIIEKQAAEIQQLKDRVTKLEAREEILVAEAKGAAAAVASTVASQHVAAISLSVGRLQGRLDGMGGKWLPPPEQDPQSD
jgi:hypothetical protein